MKPLRILTLMVLPILAALSIKASSTLAYTPLTTIPIPPNGVASMDIVFVDSALQLGFMADRTNSGIDVWNVKSNTFTGRIPAGGTGTAGAPNGVATDSSEALVFAGLGANGPGGGLLVANANTLSPITTFPMTKPGGGAATGRSDELAVDPLHKLVAVANDQDSPPFITEFSYGPTGALTMVGQIMFPTQIGCGIEQTVFVPETNQFMTALPTTGGCPGGIAVMNESPFTLTRTMPTDCSPQGMAHGPGTLMFVGCTTIAGPEIINFISGAKVATLGTLASSDEVWFDPGSGNYEFIAGAPSNTLFIYSSATNLLVEQDPLGGNFHNLAADSVSQKVFVGLRPVNTVCPTGCVSVFGPSAIFPGGGPGPQPINPSIGSGISLTSSFNPSTFGAPVTFTATLTGCSVPTGTVTFFDGAAPLGSVPLSGGMAAFTTGALSSGLHKMVAQFLGNASCQPALSALTQVVSGGPTPGSPLTAPSVSPSAAKCFAIADPIQLQACLAQVP
jgi:Bacterial Ig-like domain (group 3)